MKNLKNGWRIIKGYKIFLQDSKITKAIKKSDSGIGEVSASVYIPSKFGDWSNANGDLTLAAFKARLAKGSVKIA